MDGKWTAKVALPVLGMLCALTLPVGSAVAEEEYLCDAVQASSNELPVLKGNCPIGAGIWGKKAPTDPKGLFWIQCGILKKPMSLAKAKQLYSKISTDVWMKQEGREYRCLIGPYDDFATANQEKRKVRQLGRYKDAFVREVISKPTTKASAAPQAHQASQPAKKATKPPAKPTAKAKPAPSSKSSANATDTAPLVASSASLASTPSKSDSSQQTQIEIRRKSKLGIHTYVVPYLKNGDEAFYMEYDQPWNRMNYQSAQKLCHKLEMRLANHEEWQAILQSDELVKNQWPIHLPYWGDGNQGFFTSGKVTQLKGTSLLNVLCIQP